jgi:hypothetical protein
MTGVAIVRMSSSEFLSGQARSGGAVGDAVVETTPNERYIAGGELECRSGVVEPYPGMAPDDGVDGKLDGAG